MNSANPTLLIGLGAFGRAVAESLRPRQTDPSGWPASTVSSESALASLAAPTRAHGADTDADPDDDGDDALADAGLAAIDDQRAERSERTSLEFMLVAEDRLERDAEAQARTLTEEACAHSRRLLELGYFVDSLAPTDARGPRLDVFIVGDIKDARVARLVPPLTSELARVLRARFRPILGAGQGHLSVCPMLVASRSSPDADPGAMATCIRALATMARQPETQLRPQARVYIVEDQSGKYLLSARELVRSFAAFLSLLLESRLRDDRSVRDLIEDTGDDRVGPLATFACATLEIDITLLHELCAHRLARELLAHYHPGELTLAEIASEAHPLVPERVSLETRLWQEGSEGSLEDYLEPPHLSVPDIAWSDSPEDIVEQKFGPTWRLETQHIIDDFRDQVERFKMDRLARRIEDNGAALARETEDALVDRIRQTALASPRGPERALEFARYAATRARGLMEESQRAIDSPDLRALPESPLDMGVASIEEAARAWPRQDPFRIRFFGLLAVLVGTFAVGGLAHAILDMVVGLSSWPISGAIGAALSASSIQYNLWSHRKRHHNWLVQARHELEQSLERHLQRDLVAYFRARLAYTRDLFTYRIYRRVFQRLDDIVVQLEGARAAVDEVMRRSEARRHDLEKRRLGKETRGILYRSVLAPEVVDAVYEFTRPPDLSVVASRYHAEVTVAPAAENQPRDVLEAPYADSERVWAFAYREFSHLTETTPYQESDTPLYRAVVDAVQRYLEQLALKLSPPLEISGVHASEVPAASRIAIAPPEARPLIERILSTENLDRGWTLRPVSSDARRLHLLLERGHLPVAAVAMARETRDGGP